MRRGMAGIGALVASALCTVGSARAAEVDKRVEVIRVGGAYLGVTLDEVTKDDLARLKLNEEKGALVRSVEADSPAQKAGLKADDVILRFQGEGILSARQLSRLVREQPTGRSVAIEISRAGAAQKLQVTLGERKRAHAEGFDFEIPELAELRELRNFRFEAPEPPEPPEAPMAPRAPMAPSLPRMMFWNAAPRRLGIEYQEIGDQLAKYFKLADDRGLLVARVDEDSPAAKGGMKAGDLILKLNGKPVRDGSDLREELRKQDSGAEITISVQRDGKPLELKVKLGDAQRPRVRGEVS